MLKLCANSAEISKLAQTKSYVLPSLHCRWTMINWDRRWQKQRREKKSWRVSWLKWGSQQGLLTNGAKSFLTTYAKTTSGSTAYRNITPASLGNLRPQRSVRRRSWASSGTSSDSTSRRRTPKWCIVWAGNNKRALPTWSVCVLCQGETGTWLFIAARNCMKLEPLLLKTCCPADMHCSVMLQLTPRCVSWCGQWMRKSTCRLRMTGLYR